MITLDHLPDPRPQMRLARDSWWTVGGTSAGKALHLRQLGVDVTLVTPLGADAAGDRVREALRGAGVTLVETSAVATESHTNLMADGDRLSIYTALPGEPTDTDVELAAAAMQHADAIVVDLSSLGQAALSAAVEQDLPVWVDLHDWDGEQGFHRAFAQVATTVLINDDGGGDRDLLLRRLLDAGAQTAIRTLGARGAVAVDAAGTWYRVPAASATVVDSNGAGDAFAAGALAATLAGRDVRGALEAGVAQAIDALASRHLSSSLD